jgi:hypothetical protein
VVAEQCPRSLVTAQSWAWLEVYAAWRQCPQALAGMEAKEAEAVMAIAEMVERERDAG